MPTAREISDYLNARMLGPDISVCGARSLDSAEPGTIVFLSGSIDAYISKLNSIRDIVCVTTPDLSGRLSCTRLTHDFPRLAFCLVLDRYFSPPEEISISSVSEVAADADIGVDVSIGAGSSIGPAVKIGSGTRVGSGVVISGHVEIGTECIVRPNATIGENGFGYAIASDGEPVSFPHIGSVKIGNRVEIGSSSNIARAALDHTVIGDHVKMDCFVSIAHNVEVGPRTLIGAGAVVSGSTIIGADAWIGPNVTVIDKVTVGDRAHIGLGSVVVRSVESRAKVFGNPARKIPSAR